MLSLFFFQAIHVTLWATLIWKKYVFLIVWGNMFDKFGPAMLCICHLSVGQSKPPLVAWSQIHQSWKQRKSKQETLKGNDQNSGDIYIYIYTCKSRLFGNVAISIYRWYVFVEAKKSESYFKFHHGRDRLHQQKWQKNSHQINPSPPRDGPRWLGVATKERTWLDLA